MMQELCQRAQLPQTSSNCESPMFIIIRHTFKTRLLFASAASLSTERSDYGDYTVNLP